MSVLEIVLLVALLLAVAAVVGLAVPLAMTRRALASSRRTNDKLRRELVEARQRRTATRGERAVKTLVGTAARMRSEGVQGFLASSMEDLTSWAVDDPEIAEVAGPDGRVTILFSDIKNSTALNADLGDRAWMLLLGAHDRVVRGRVERFHGHIVKTQGDGFMIVFGDATQAVRAALSIHRGIEARRGLLWLQPIQVRIGMHSGPTVSRDGDYFGSNVAAAARVAALADGGETLLTSQVRDLVEDEEAGQAKKPEFTFTDLGEQELKGLPGEYRISKVAPRGKPRKR